MRRTLVILVGALTLGAAVFAGSFLLSRQICARHGSASADDLTWLCCEFDLNSDELARIRQLHEGYLPKCAEMCSRIAAKKEELDSKLANATDVTAEIEKELLEIGELRAQCQAQMLRHFVQVSRAMPAEQGKRYLIEMEQLTLGYHERIEQTMSGHADHEHHHE